MNTARERLDARYAALAILDPARIQIDHFVTAGIDKAARKAIGAHPRGRGILGLVFLENKPLRSDDVERDARSYGFPPAHPVMHSFLGVPVPTEGKPLGSFYATDKQTGRFNDADEHTATAIALAAARLIETFQSRQPPPSHRGNKSTNKPSSPPLANASDRGSHARCPRCGLTIASRARWLTVEHCPRCLVRARTLIQMHPVETPSRK